MASWRFEIANWNETGALAKAMAVRDAEAQAMNITLNPEDTAAFDAVAQLVNEMVSTLQLTDRKVRVKAEASVPDQGAITISMNFIIDPPQAV